MEFYITAAQRQGRSRRALMRAKEDEKTHVPRETLVFFCFQSKVFHVEHKCRFENYSSMFHGTNTQISKLQS
jgi:hypothetical protein